MTIRSSSALKWAVPALTVAYLLTASLALSGGSSRVAAAAIAILLAGILLCIRGPRRHVLRFTVALVGLLIVLGVAAGRLSPWPLLMPPILVPATLAWVFGRSLLPNRIPLIERFARIFHAPDGLPDGVAQYTRRVTWCWALLLAAIAVGNLWMALHVFPGGLLHVAGRRSPWPVSPAAFAWLSNVGSYLLIGGMFVVEFIVRLIRFPEFEFRNPVAFLERARSRLPQMLEGFRHD
jgi:uncharacterized membrane protein